MATEIWSHNMEMRPQCPSSLVPSAAVIAATMDKYEWRRCVIAPVGILQPQALGFVEAVCWPD